MRRRPLVGWGLLLTAACHLSPARRCSQNADCPSNNCDTSLGVCVASATCAVPCSAWQTCVQGSCAPIYSGIAIQTPSRGAVINAPVSVTAALSAVPGRTRADPATLSFTADGGVAFSGTLALVDAGLYQGVWTPGPEGDYALTAAWTDAGLVSPAIAVAVDRTPPVFTLVTQRSDGGPWLRDEVAAVQVFSAEPHMDATSVTLTVEGVDGGNGIAVAVTPTTPCAVAYCGIAQVDMSQPSLPADKGVFPATVTGRDLAGNAGSADAGISVTRWKWVFDTGTGLLPTSPAVGRTGNIYFGTSQGIQSLLYALRPDGSVRWSVDAGSFFASPSVGAWSGTTEVVYAAAKSTSAVFVAVDGISGAVTHQCASGTNETASLGVTTTSLNEPGLETAFGVLEGTPAKFMAFRPSATAPGEDCYLSSLAGIPGAGPATAVLIDDANNAYVGSATGSIESNSFVAATGWASHAGWPVKPNLYMHALAAVGTQIVGGGGGPGTGALVAVQFDGGGLWMYPPGAAASPAWDVAIATGGVATYGDSTPALTSIAVGASTPAATALPAPTTNITTAPVLGQGGYVYTVDTFGDLTAWTPALRPAWSALLPAGTTSASPALDCARDATGAVKSGPGVLYVPTDTGRIYAFVVDSHGLDTTAPWPKFQHDPRNTGNMTTPLAEFTCP